MVTNISTILIDATKQKVWEVLTNPKFVKQWQFGSDLVTSWVIGDKIEFVTEWEGNIFKQWGNVLTFIPTDSLSYTLFATRPDLEDKPENYFIMNYRLTDIEGKTKLEIIQQDHRPNAVQEDSQGEENPMLQGLKNIAEKN